ncbi:MarR family transcriptional regulator [Actinomadura sp. ATCC 31491]|uniref:MarR family transcriptional regulator n=1 Tax=Actinomadura luzonensis TaxID=2805427 RepID=A0ABT0FY74_9ACTN|nr:MarR family transcriptional regulator [Actinomadura luzonensis]MCK2217277.1 MarR family transcriptional regulator [Actinomadura luzonensis]
MTPPTPVTAPAPSREAAMWSGVLLLHARVESRLATALQRRHGIGLSEYRALGHLAAAPAAELRMQELADRLGLNQSSVTRLVARLQTAGFAYRDVCPDDKRGVYTVITEDGRARHAAASGTYEEVLRSALAEAAADPQLAATVTALQPADG